MNKEAGENMKKKIIIGATTLLLMTTLTGCQVHFGRDAVTIGEQKQTTKKVTQKKKQSSVKKATPKKREVKKPKKSNKVKKSKKVSKPKKKVVKATLWNQSKNKKLQKAVNKWGAKASQVYRYYDGTHSLKTKKGPTYPDIFKQSKFVLSKKAIQIGYSPLGKNRYQYNVVAIANDDFKSWHNTYLFCLKNKKPVILLDQSKNGNPIVVKIVKDKSLNQIFEQIYR